jgi:transglutaminase-like putative cysteine protease
MMRASGIPARFEIGFPIPESKTEGDIGGYHCWAEFYLNGVGWVPVDASEAWKNPAKHNCFFGAADVNRVFFTYGRDIRLSSEQKGGRTQLFHLPLRGDQGAAGEKPADPLFLPRCSRNTAGGWSLSARPNSALDSSSGTCLTPSRTPAVN